MEKPYKRQKLEEPASSNAFDFINNTPMPCFYKRPVTDMEIYETRSRGHKLNLLKKSLKIKKDKE